MSCLPLLTGAWDHGCWQSPRENNNKQQEQLQALSCDAEVLNHVQGG